jgi:hypothetical protein
MAAERPKGPFPCGEDARLRRDTTCKHHMVNGKAATQVMRCGCFAVRCTRLALAQIVHSNISHRSCSLRYLLRLPVQERILDEHACYTNKGPLVPSAKCGFGAISTGIWPSVSSRGQAVPVGRMDLFLVQMVYAQTMLCRTAGYGTMDSMLP